MARYLFFFSISLFYTCLTSSSNHFDEDGKEKGVINDIILQIYNTENIKNEEEKKQKDSDGLAIIWYLNYHPDHHDIYTSVVWKTLKLLRHDNSKFKKLLNDITEEAHKYYQDYFTNDIREIIDENYVPISPKERVMMKAQYVKEAIDAIVSSGSVPALMMHWETVDPASKELIISNAGISTEVFLHIMSKAGQYAIKPGALLGASYVISHASYLIVVRWYYKGDIDGKYVAKYIVDDLMIVTSTIGMGAAGAAACSYIPNPIAPIACGIAAGGLGWYLTAEFVDELTQWIFDLAPTPALELAHKFLEVHHTASNKEVNEAYYKLLTKYHPRSDGYDAKMLTKTKASFLIIKSHREKEMFVV